MSALTDRIAGLSRMITVLVVLLLVAGAVFVFVDRTASRTVTVDFPRTNSLYEGSDVKILGVAVGTVDKLTPRGETVRAEISYPQDIRLPEDVKAVIVSPSIVGDRFVQLAPAFDGGAELDNGAVLGPDRTEVPVELDEIYSSLDELAVALGPEGANEDGALSSLVDDTAEQLDGQGAQLNQTIQNFGQLSQTLSNNKDNLFGSVREVSQFVDLLGRNDDDVRAFFDATAEVSEVLEGEREDLALTLQTLGDALVEVRTLVRDNREELRGNVQNLQSLAEVLAQHEADLEEIMVAAPTALTNVALTYNAEQGTLDNHVDVVELVTGILGSLPNTVCNLLTDTTDGIPFDPGFLGDLLGELGNALRPVCDTLAELTGEAAERVAGAVADEEEAPEGEGAPEGEDSEQDISPELLQQLREGLGVERTSVASQDSPDRSHTSLEDMLAVQ